jgi:FAD/FMN-containing dehydrogenase
MSARPTRKSFRRVATLALLWAALVACGLAETRKVEQAGEASCPGVSFAVGCGDRACDARAGEDRVSCPADCSAAAVRSYNAQTLCEDLEALVEPASVGELQAVIRRARAEQRPVRVIGRRHTSNEQLCSDGYVVSTAKLTEALHIERFEGVETVVTEPGIRLGDLNDWLDARGRSLGFAVLGTRDPTIAGAIATGSHGSSPHHSDVLSNLVQSIDLVGADGELHEYSRGRTPPAMWKTLTASLGLAGVMTRLRLRIEPSFNLGVEVTYHSDLELGRGAGPIDYVRECDYGQLNWFPGQHRVVKTCGIRSELPRQVGATNRLLAPDFAAWISGPAERALQHGSCRAAFNCRVLERLRLRQFVNTPPFFRKMHAESADRSQHFVVGGGARMMSSELTDLQEGIVQHDFELAIPAQNAAAAFAAARRYFDAEDLCFPLVGVFIRFARVEDESWLAHTGASGRFRVGDTAVFFEMPIYIPGGISEARMAEYLRPYKEWVRRLIVDFGARPHWGKNDAWVFDLQDPAVAYGDGWDTFRATITELDPDGMFANPWLIARGLRGAPEESRR